ncbi:MAG: hypothetical protein KAV87_48290 [Desulfobacteraceae bacterium]|nr:hypothetical protein [Desulfobacteraceae bacterium]
MAERVPLTLFEGALLVSTGNTLLYSVPSNQKLSNVQTTVVNVSTSGSYLFDLWFVEAGEAIDNNKMIHKNKSVTAGTSYSSPHTAIHTLEAGTLIYASPDTANVLSLRLSGVLITLNNPV